MERRKSNTRKEIEEIAADMPELELSFNQSLGHHIIEYWDKHRGYFCVRFRYLETMLGFIKWYKEVTP